MGRSRQDTSVINLTVPDVRFEDHDWRVTIAELRPGGEVEGVFACTRKDRLTAKNGSPYLAVELRDRTGAIPGRAFRDADFLAAQFERGDLVAVRGRVERFRDELQVELRSIKRAAEEVPDPSEFLPVAYRDMEEMEGFLEHLAREVYDADLRALLDSFIGDDAFRAEFRRAPCTRSGHHAYLGGLLEHTVAVATLAFETCALHPRLNSDLLLTAAILHDVGKTLEFQLGAEIALSEAGALVGHVTLGQQLVTERARRLDGFPEAKLHAISHCILAHHGPDALPGRRFRSAEALALYRLNALDAGVKGALEGGLE
ncbi:MAG: 3-5 exoribonuclease [Thermoleophilaceae bacterium]|nr:3-5 exoribonuclease [Thermoleophilaceae bacterium]